MGRAPVSSERLQAILADKRTEITQAIRDANDAHSRLMRLLMVYEIAAEHDSCARGGLTPEQQRLGNELEYLLDIFKVYARTNARDRKNQMEVLAESYQRHPDKIVEILKYFGLEL